MDGVLLQSRASHARAFEEILAAYDIFDFSYESFAGRRTGDVFREVFAIHGYEATEPEIADCSRRKSQRARELVATASAIMDDCIPVIKEFSNRYRLALASSGSRESVDLFLEMTGLGGAFGSVLSGNDVGAAKPDPELFRRSISALGLEPGECVVIEDAAAGIIAARRAGARAIGFIADGTSAAGGLLTSLGAEAVVGSLSELRSLLSCHD